MDNFLDNGTVLPFGLLGSDNEAAIAGFNKTYKNTQLRMGIVVRSYDSTDPNNYSKLTTEYDVLVFEQNEDKGSSIITYKNCISQEGMGSIADFFEKNLRVQKVKNNNQIVNTTGQDGPVVLIHCLDGMTEKAIIIGAVTHPDRDTTLKNTAPYMQGEYNGVNIIVNTDGSTMLTFKGATDNYGKVLDASQGPTTLQIKQDGSFVLTHSTITLDLERSGDATLTVTGNGNVTINANKDVTVNAKGNINANCQNATITAQQTATVEGSSVKLGKNATEAVVKGNTFQEYFNSHIHPTAVGPSGPPVTPMPASNLSTKVVTE